jgi:hypothetical protein
MLVLELLGEGPPDLSTETVVVGEVLGDPPTIILSIL